MVEAAAKQLNVPPAKFAAFKEVYDAQGARGAQRWEEYLKKVRSNAEVEQRLAERPELLAPFHAQGGKVFENAKQRLMFCGRYSTKAGTPLDAALDTAIEGLKAAQRTAEIFAPGKMKIAVGHGRFNDDHMKAREGGFPYRPSVSAGNGTPVIEAHAAEDSEAAKAGTLLGYVAMQGSYIDDIAVLPQYHGQAVASALICGAAHICGSRLSLDVRAANTPAILLYQYLGFQFGRNTFPGFLDWDGGFEGEADSKVVKSKTPANADISKLLN